MKITFRLLTEQDFSKVHQWLNRPHVAKWFGGPFSLRQVEDRYKGLIQSDKAHVYVVVVDDIDTGVVYIFQDDSGDWRIDQYIGEEKDTGHGLGPRFIKLFVEKMFIEFNPDKIVAHVHSKNLREQKCYQKAGFVKKEATKTGDEEAIIVMTVVNS